MEKDLLKGKRIRAVYLDKMRKWYFSAVDVCAVLTGKKYDGARIYWKGLRHKLKLNPLMSDCKQLKMASRDGKLRFTEVLDITQVLYILQIVSVKEAEPFRIWLAQTAAASGAVADRLVEIGKENLSRTKEEIMHGGGSVQLRSAVDGEIPVG